MWLEQWVSITLKHIQKFPISDNVPWNMSCESLAMHCHHVVKWGRFIELRILFIKNCKHIYIVLAVWDPDNMYYEKWEADIYVPQNVARLIYWHSREQSLKLNMIIQHFGDSWHLWFWSCTHCRCNRQRLWQLCRLNRGRQWHRNVRSGRSLQCGWCDIWGSVSGLDTTFAEVLLHVSVDHAITGAHLVAVFL